MEELETYITRNHNTVDKYIVTWTILGLCMKAENQPGHGWENGGEGGVESCGSRGGRGGGRVVRGLWLRCRIYGYTMQRDTTATITIGTYHNSLLASALGEGIHHPIMSMLWGYGGRLDREREDIMQNKFQFNPEFYLFLI